MQKSPNSNIQIALIGAGGMGQGDARMATSLPGVKLIAACDIYDGRLRRAKEIWGDSTFTTRDYREILNRKDVDSVIIATPDHWHATITKRRARGRQGRLLREADGPEDRRRTAGHRSTQEDPAVSCKSAVSTPAASCS